MSIRRRNVNNTDKDNDDNDIDEKDKLVDISGDQGVMKCITREGRGQCVPNGKFVQVHYTGLLLDGTVFDNSRYRGVAFTFELGAAKVIRGWDIVVASMKKGERAKVVIQSNYAYGKRALGKIPSDATLIFDMEVLGWTSFDPMIFQPIIITASIIIGLASAVYLWYIFG